MASAEISATITATTTETEGGGTSTNNDCLLGKSRTTAKEVVSSRWAMRAETSSRMKTKQQQQQQKQSIAKGRNNPNSSSSDMESKLNLESTSCHSNLKSDAETETLFETGVDVDLGPVSVSSMGMASNSNRMNIICHTWQQIQKSINWNALQILDKQQRGQVQNPKQNPSNSNPKQNPNKHSKAHKSKNPKHAKNNTGTKTTTHNNHKTNKHTKRVIVKNPKNSKNNAEMLANTLTQMRVTNAIQTQLESLALRMVDENASKASTTDTNNNNQFNYLNSVIRILPVGFNETSALMSSISVQERKRAFMLLDLGRVIRAHAKFLSYTCGFGTGDVLPPTHQLRRTTSAVNSIGRKKRGLYIQPQFCVTKNPNIQLLKLLVRLGVDLRCHSSDDVITANRALMEEKRERKNANANIDFHHDHPCKDEDENDSQNHDESTLGLVLVDDASKTRKPNGYFRRLLQNRQGQQQQQHQQNDDGDDEQESFLEVAVDGVDEVRRISNTIRRLSSQTESSSTTCRFILRLPPIQSHSNEIESISTSASTQNDGLWEKLILNVFTAAKEQEGELYGVSVDLSSWSELLPQTNSKTRSDAKDDEKEQQHLASQVILNKVCTRLRLFRLLLLSVGQYHIRIDLTGLPPSLTRDHCNILTQTLSNVVSCNVSIEELIQVHVTTLDLQNSVWKDQLEQIRDLANDPSTCSLVYTADISTHLVARAGALCARIIGVKSKHAVSREDGEDDGVAAIRGEKDVSMHYFIDDGCYGSLGSSSSCSSNNKKHVPVYLYGNNPLPKTQSYVSLSTSKSLKLESPTPPDAFIDTSKHVLSTVWGPTCDGLDKVCAAVLLPKDLKANRDWLVFSDLGCGGFGGGLGLGTAFNGFDPPDVAYCVLGYFTGGRDCLDE